MRHLCCKKENLHDIIKQYEKTDTNPLGLIKINKKNIPYVYSLETTSYDELHNYLETYLKGTMRLVQSLMKQLKKPLFKNVKAIKLERGGNALSYKIQKSKISSAWMILAPKRVVIICMAMPPCRRGVKESVHSLFTHRLVTNGTARKTGRSPLRDRSINNCRIYQPLGASPRFTITTGR